MTHQLTAGTDGSQLEARDPDAAERAMRKHIAASRQLLQVTFQA